MNRFFPIAFAALFAAIPGLRAGVVSQTFTLGTDITDGSSSGLLDIRTIASVEPLIQEVTIGLSISASPGKSSFLGDLYAYVEHDGIMSVLLNRPGRTDAELAGYDDNQSVTVTFQDGSPDIHSYRSAPGTPLTGALTGTWGPDGRATDPSTVVQSDGRTLLLSGFAGRAVAGDWKLFVADLSGGGEHRLTQWSLSILTTVIPEPPAYLGTGVLILTWLGWRHCVGKNTRRPSPSRIRG